MKDTHGHNLGRGTRDVDFELNLNVEKPEFPAFPRDKSGRYCSLRARA